MKIQRFVFISFCMIMSVFLFACHMKDNAETTEKVNDTSSASAVPSTKVDNSSTDHLPPVVTTSSEVVKASSSAYDDSKPRIVWAVNRTAYISEDVQAQIQNFLDGKGIDCKIEFTPLIMEMGSAYAKWLNEQKEAGTTPDILTGCLWEHGIVELADFVEKELQPLNVYLDSEEGRGLYEAYAEVEWARTAVNGNVYAVPLRQRDYRNASAKFYICVNDHYKDDFEAYFDGSYASVRTASGALSTTHPILMIPALSSMDIPAALLGLENVFYASYNWDISEMIDLTKKRELKDLLIQLYLDYQEGRVVDAASLDLVSDDAFAYIASGNIGVKEGYIEYALAPELYLSSPGSGSYGIYSGSEKKDLAFQVLSACYSDPKIASLIFWRVADEEKWNERTEYLRTCHASPLSGFIPELSVEEMETLQTYKADLDGLVMKMHLNNGVVQTLNADFTKLVDDFFETHKDYGDVIEKVNRQVQEWIISK